MGPNIVLPVSVAGNKRGRRGSDSDDREDNPFLLAVSRAFLNAVNAEDKSAAVLYSRALLALMNRT